MSEAARATAERAHKLAVVRRAAVKLMRKLSLKYSRAGCFLRWHSTVSAARPSSQAVSEARARLSGAAQDEGQDHAEDPYRWMAEEDRFLVQAVTKRLGRDWAGIAKEVNACLRRAAAAKAAEEADAPPRFRSRRRGKKGANGATKIPRSQLLSIRRRSAWQCIRRYKKLQRLDKAPPTSPILGATTTATAVSYTHLTLPTLYSV